MTVNIIIIELLFFVSSIAYTSLSQD